MPAISPPKESPSWFDPPSRRNALHVLVVDNDPDDRRRILEMLEDLRDPISKQAALVHAVSNIEAAREYLLDDSIDIFVLDLIMHESADSLTESEEIGKAFVHEVVAKSHAGIIIFSSLPPIEESPALLEAGADDYIWKYPETSDHNLRDVVRSRVRAVWRRVQLNRLISPIKPAHSQRVFLIGEWRFSIGNRTLIKSNGETARISNTEHAFLRYICTIETHEVTLEAFNIEILGREKRSDWHLRMDNFLYRLRRKLGDHVQFASQRGGVYKLIDVRELKVGTD